MEEGGVLERISVNDAEAFGELIRRYYPALLGFASGIIGDRASAEDVVQEVFVRFWEQRANATTITSLRNYLYVSARNLAMNHIRSEKRLSERHGRMPREEEGFRSLVIEEETFRLLAEAIDALPVRSATVLKLTLEGLSLEEIAARMQVSVNTVKSTKAYAVNKLKAQLGNAVYLLSIQAFFISIS